MPDVPSIFPCSSSHPPDWSLLLIPASTRQCPGPVPPPLPPRRTPRLRKTDAKLKDEMMKHGKWELLLDFFGKIVETSDVGLVSFFWKMGLDTVAFWKCFRSCLEHHFGLLPLLCLQMKTHHHTNLSPGPGNHPKSKKNILKLNQKKMMRFNKIIQNQLHKTSSKTTI